MSTTICHQVCFLSKFFFKYFKYAKKNSLYDLKDRKELNHHLKVVPSMLVVIDLLLDDVLEQAWYMGV